MKFLIDNALSPLVANELRSHGYDAVHVRDVGMAASNDEDILEYAAREERTLISADTDFGALLAFRNVTQPSFILFRQTDKRPIAQIQILLANLDTLQESLHAGCVVVIEDRRIRVRELPISNDS